MPANTDLTTLLVNHFITLRAANAQNAKDLSTAFNNDVPTVRADAGASTKDLNQDEYRYLQTHS